ncbi:MAG: thioesterase domain-containing protein [Proteobacteria bacterium]|nr:thioesterase domain-containing protein [Pseudomonadota bacterium]
MMKQLQDFLHQEIPLTKDMDLALLKFDGLTLQAKAPLKNNINDKGSVFGGSSSALMIIAAWSLIKLNCQDNEIQADIVIHKNETIWQKALYGDLTINTRFQNDPDFQQVKVLLDSKKHKRVTCLIELIDVNGNIYEVCL